MKHLVIAIISALNLLLVIKTNAQVTDLTIDFSTKNITPPPKDSLKPGNFLRLRINNFDWTGKYSVTINKKDSVISIPEPPQLFKILFLGQDFTNLLAGLTDFTPKIPSLTKTDSSKISEEQLNKIFGKKTEEKFSLMGGSLDDFSAIMNATNEEQESNFSRNFKSIVQILRQPTANRATLLRQQINAEPVAWVETASELLKYRNYFNDQTVTNILLLLQAEELSKIQREAQVSATLTQILNFKNQIISQHGIFENTLLIPTITNLYGLENGTITPVNFQTQATNLINTRYTLATTFNSLFQSYLDYSIPFSDLISTNKSLARADSVVLNYRKGFYEFMKGYDSLFNYNTILVAVRKARNSSEPYVSLPFQITKDLTQLDISITPYESSKNLPSFSTSYLLPHRASFYWMFSTGFFINGLADKNYSNKPKVINVNDTVYNLIEEKTGNVSFGAMALLHTGGYFKNSDIGYHFAFGPGISVEKKPAPRLLLGTGLTMGKQSKIVLTIGAVIGNVKKLSQSYDLTSNYSKPQTEVTVNKMQASWFFGLSYSIFGK
jgi:hypothetical protein